MSAQPVDALRGGHPGCDVGWDRLRLVPTAVLASMAGGLVTLALGATAPQAPLVTERMRAQVHLEVAAEGASAVRHQPLSGIPVKVYAAEAGRAHVAPLPFLEVALAHRGVRIALVGAGCALLGGLLRRARHLYPAVLTGGTALFAAGFALVVAGWSGPVQPAAIASIASTNSCPGATNAGPVGNPAAAS